MTARERFMDLVYRSEDGCWLWTGNCNQEPKNYGRFKLNDKLWMAHRAAYELFVGPIPDGLTIDHLCRVRRCVNPAHLEPVTVGENIRRGTQGDLNRAKTRCPRGHAYDAENTYINPKRQRICRACLRERARERRAA